MTTPRTSKLAEIIDGLNRKITRQYEAIRVDGDAGLYRTATIRRLEALRDEMQKVDDASLPEGGSQ